VAVTDERQRNPVITAREGRWSSSALPTVTNEAVGRPAEKQPPVVTRDWRVAGVLVSRGAGYRPCGGSPQRYTRWNVGTGWRRGFYLGGFDRLGPRPAYHARLSDARSATDQLAEALLKMRVFDISQWKLPRNIQRRCHRQKHAAALTEGLGRTQDCRY